jgi:hypothetical protein
MPGIADLVGKIRHMMNSGAAETFNPATDSLEAIANAVAALGGGVVTAEGLYYSGPVTAVPGANQFTIPTLAGLGAGKFSDATQPYWAFVLRNGAGAGAAPQGEMKAITGYVTATGVFTTGAFTAAVAATDEILILHPALARVLSNYTLLTGIAGVLGVPAVSLDTLLGARWDGAGDLGTDIATIINASSAAAAYAIINSGLSFLADVTSKVGCGANDFICANLVGVGAGAFADVSAPYRCFVFRDAGAAAAAPQGETQSITAYVSASGKFTTSAFTASVEVGDTVIIMHPRLAELASILSKVTLTPTTASHDVTTVNDQAETDVFSIARTGAWKLSCYLDLATLVTAVEGGTVTVRYYMKVDGTNYAKIGESVFIVGTTTIMPSCEIIMGRHGFKATIQCSTSTS